MELKVAFSEFRAWRASSSTTMSMIAQSKVHGLSKSDGSVTEIAEYENSLGVSLTCIHRERRCALNCLFGYSTSSRRSGDFLHMQMRNLCPPLSTTTAADSLLMPYVTIQATKLGQ